MLQLNLCDPRTVLDCIQLNSNTIYLPILKCANTLIQDSLAANNYAKTTNRTASRVVIVTRDPIERWVSGIATYMRIWHSDLTTATAARYALDCILAQTLTPDLHTVPQSAYVAHLTANQLIQYDMAHINTFLSTYNAQPSPNAYRNSTSEHSYMRWISQFIQPLAHKLEPQLRELYKHDYELRSQCPQDQDYTQIH